MTSRLSMLLIFIIGFISANAQQNEEVNSDESPCNCHVALRYDHFKSKNNFYSEIAYGKYLEKIKTGSSSGGITIGVSIPKVIGLELGSDHSRRAQSKYKEYMYNETVMDNLSEYESRVTSSVSYETYARCMEACLGKEENGLYVYRVSEDAEKIIFRIAYNNKAGGKIKVEYNYNDEAKSVSVKANTKSDVTVEKEDNKPFNVVFSAPNTSYSIPTENVLRYEPIDQMYTIRYTINQHEKELGSVSEKTANNHYRKWKESYKQTTPNRDSLKAGTYKFWKKVGNLTATNLFIVIEAGENEKLEDISLNYAGPKGWRNPAKPENGFLVKTNKKIVYNIYCWSKPTTITISFAKVFEQTKNFEFPIFSEDGRLHFAVPTKATNKQIVYDRGGTKTISFEGNNEVVRAGDPITSDDLTFWSFEVANQN